MNGFKLPIVPVTTDDVPFLLLFTLLMISWSSRLRHVVEYAISIYAFLQDFQTPHRIGDDLHNVELLTISFSAYLVVFYQIFQRSIL